LAEDSEAKEPAEPSGLAATLDRTFGISAAGTSVPTELRAGLTTFLTMAYIMFVNPAILEKAGMDHGAVFVATCLAAALSTAIMGLYANYPIALAPGMGSTPISPSPWCLSSAAIGSSRLALCSCPARCSF
jgi:Permease family